jgi:glycosyltransferase involved in cell wall biosynthesis
VDTSYSISVLIATYNRASALEQTLEAFTSLQNGRHQIEWVIIDNNSSDSTRAVVERFKHKLPLVYLFEPRAGKNCALNTAMRKVNLGEIVVFADDDITPDPSWLQEIALSCSRHPSCAVFGGRIIPEWPEGSMPRWAQDRFIQMFGFSLHDFGPTSRAYDPGIYPFGPNFWIRRTIIEQGHRYDERVGPRPTKRIMGSETTFLRNIERAGFKPLYYPYASVRHRISSSGCSPAVVRQRAFRLGRGEIYLSGLPRPELHARSRRLWEAYLLVKLTYSVLLRMGAYLSVSENTRLLRAVTALRIMGNAIESWQYSEAPTS